MVWGARRATVCHPDDLHHHDVPARSDLPRSAPGSAPAASPSDFRRRNLARSRRS